MIFTVHMEKKIYNLFKQLLCIGYLLLHVVTLSDHVPSALQERKGDPDIRYPVWQEREAWEPNEVPQEREAMDT